MLEKTVIEGRPASVAYLDRNFVPVDADDATMVKVIFDDGEVMFATADENTAKAFDPSEPRDEIGRWTDGGGSASGGAIASGGGPKVVAFHGTIENVVDRIKGEGLHVTPKSHHFDGDVYAGERGESVFVTTSAKTAIQYAETYAQAESWKEYKAIAPVVFKLEVPEEDWRKFNEDRLEPESYYTKTIPPEWIEGVYKIGDADTLERIKAAAGMATAYLVIFVGEPKDAKAWEKFNPHHKPSGPGGGQFTTGGDDELGSMALGGEDRNITAATREVDALRDEMGIVEADIPFEQRQALDMYSQDSYTFNQLARGGPGPAAPETEHLDALVGSYTLPHDVTVYRTVGWQRTQSLLNHDGSFSDPGFMSTTFDKSKIDKPGSYIEIQIPKGSKAFPVGSLSNYPEEAEIIFPRDSRLQIVSHEPRAAPNTERFVARLVS